MDSSRDNSVVPDTPEDGGVPQMTVQRENSADDGEIGDECGTALNASNALNLIWAFGISKDVEVHNISDGNREAIFYATAHTGVIFDYITNKQKLLQGHCNNIACTSVCANRRWLVTADCGKDSMVIVWDSYTSIPVRTIFDAHPTGCIAVCMTPDAKYLATLSATTPQVISLWDWTNEGDDPVWSLTLEERYGRQHYISFSSSDSHQLVSNSENQVVFYFWNGAGLHHSAPPLTDEDFNKVVGLFSQSVFQTSSTKVLTATSQGNIVVWDGGSIDMPCNRKAFKIVRLQEKGINVLTSVDSYIVTGDIVGHIKFLDLELRLLNWYNKLGAGPIKSVSFSSAPLTADDEELPTMEGKHPHSATLDARPFVVNDFAYASETANVGLLRPEQSLNQFLLRQHDAPVHAMVAHPVQPRICIGGYSGLLQQWDYEKREVVISRSFGAKVFIQCLAFNPTGSLLAVGCTDGTVRILDGLTLSDEGQDDGVAIFKHCHGCITHLTFSHDSKYLASADLDHCVTLFQAITGNSSEPWLYLGKQRAHYKRIADIIFGIALDSDIPRLLSVGEDRLMVEYDVMNSCIDDVRLISSDRIEQSAVPTCFGWYPPVVKESFLVVANDQFKLKLYNSTTKMCRKTLLGPTYGSPVKKLIMLPNKVDSEKHYMAYITTDKVGLQILPLDGNPHKAMALIAHPSHVSNVISSNDGRFLFTAGGIDTSILTWQVNVQALEAAAQLGGEDLAPFYGVLEGGKYGDLMLDMEDYFYYALLRSQGIDTVASRATNTRMPLDQVPFVMRALGYYPTEQEVDDMINEVKFSEYVETGKYVEDIDLGEVIKLYANHRPVFGLSSFDLQDAFSKLGYHTVDGFTIDRDELLSVLQNKGEHMTEGELSQLLSTLLGITDVKDSAEVSQPAGDDDENILSHLKSYLPEQISLELFAGKVLGFDVEAEQND